MPSRHFPSAVELVRQYRGQDVVDESGLPRAGDARDSHETAEGERHRHIPQVVLTGRMDGQRAARGRLPPDVGHRYLAAARQVRPGDRGLLAEQRLHRTGHDDRAAMLTSPRPDVHHPVGGADRVLVVFDDDQGVTKVAQPDQRLDEATVVPLVQADRRLVQDVEDPDQPRTDLGGEPDPLRLPPGQRAGGTVQGQVVQPDVEQEREPRVDLLEYPAGDRPFPLGELERPQELGAFPDGHSGHLGDRTTAQGHRQ